MSTWKWHPLQLMMPFFSQAAGTADFPTAFPVAKGFSNCKTSCCHQPNCLELPWAWQWLYWRLWLVPLPEMGGSHPVTLGLPSASTTLACSLVFDSHQRIPKRLHFWRAFGAALGCGGGSGGGTPRSAKDVCRLNFSLSWHRWRNFYSLSWMTTLKTTWLQHRLQSTESKWTAMTVQCNAICGVGNLQNTHITAFGHPHVAFP